MKLKFKLFFLLALLVPLSSFAQDVNWKNSSKKISDNEYDLVFTANIPMMYYMYSMEKTTGPQELVFNFEKSDKYTLVGNVKSDDKIKTKFDEGFRVEVTYYDGKVTFTQRVKVNEASEVKGSAIYQICTDGACIPGSMDFSIKVGTESTSAVIIPTEKIDVGQASTVEKAEVVPSKSTGKSEKSMILFFIGALLTGLASVFMPCVFPMIPMIVSFFMSGTRSKGVSFAKGLIFGLSITLVYTLVGVIVALTQNETLANVISTHWVSNLIFFALFFAFALSFFGMFEISLPTGLANKADKQVDKGGYMASFFLAIVLAIVSFSCTGPFVGGILVQAARGGVAVNTIIGMAGFGFGLGLPFVVLSLMPSLMQKLPKSGGWLNSVKIVFGFVLLALSVKFLDIAETSLGMNIITRDIFIAIWIVIAIILGIYLLGKIKFAQDSDVPHVSVFRLFLAMASFTFAVYLVPGLFGAQLSSVSAMLPAQQDQVFDLTKVESHIQSSPQTAGEINFTPITFGEKIRHSEFLSMPKGVKGYFDLKQGLEAAKKENKPVLLDFKGHKCGNCKKMEAEVFVDKRVIDELNNNFIVIGLYTDDYTELPENEWVTSANGKVRKTIGAINAEYQASKFGQVAQPYFVIIDSNENELKEGMGYTSSANDFLKWLKIK